MKKFIKRHKKAAILVTGGIVVGVAAGIGIKVGYDKIFSDLAKDLVLIRGPVDENTIGFAVTGSNMLGQKVVESHGVYSVSNWVEMFLASLNDPTVGNTVVEELVKQAPDILFGTILEKVDPKVLADLGIKVTKF